MAGIIDSKSRILDTIITSEGRRQLANGGIDIRYVSFTDAGTFYKADVDEGSQDATQRIYLESCQLPQDNVTFQGNAAGEIQSFMNGSSLATTNGGQILEYSFSPPSSLFIGAAIQDSRSLKGAKFSAAADALLGSAAENFNNLYLIASTNALFEDDGFEMGPNAVTFAVTNDRPVPRHSFTANINALDSVFADPRFSNVRNFKFLPPINYDSRRPLATYTRLGILKEMSFFQIQHELQYYESLGQMQRITFDPTSGANNVMGQFFEVGNDKIRKLDIIEYGRDPDGNSHVFFVGKCEVDQNGTDTFLHLFTLIFER